MDRPGTGPRFLIIALRYLGDVLFSTALAVSIRRRHPSATVDFLVFKGTESVLERNPCVDAVHTMAQGISGWRTFARLWKRYDVAIGTNASDRTAICAFGSARRSISFTGRTPKEWWKERLLTDCRPYDDQMHMLPLMTTQLEPLGIEPVRRPSVGRDPRDTAFAREHLGDEPFILLHPYTRKSYKCWPPEAWVELARRIQLETRMRPVLTRTPYSADAGQFAAITAAARDGIETFPVPFTMSQLAAAIRLSRAFVGVDTVATHLAAALDAPVIGIYGPTRTRNWGPWPNDWPTSVPYDDKGAVQRRGNITVVRMELPCVPCGLETCAISSRGKMECLEGLGPELVFAELERRIQSGKTYSH